MISMISVILLYSKKINNQGESSRVVFFQRGLESLKAAQRKGWGDPVRPPPSLAHGIAPSLPCLQSHGFPGLEHNISSQISAIFPSGSGYVTP